jgi:hypothetical protein
MRTPLFPRARNLNIGNSFGVPDVTSAGTGNQASFQGNQSWPSSFFGVMPFPIIDGSYFTLTGTNFEQLTKQEIMMCCRGKGRAAFAVMPTIAQRVGDEQPFRSRPPLNEDDAAQGRMCTKCQKWCPSHDVVYCDGRPYCRRHARMKNKERVV